MLNKQDFESMLDRVHEWIRSADQKVNILLAFQGVLVTLIASNFFHWFLLSMNVCNLFSFLFFAAAIVSISCSFIKIFRALVPNINNRAQEKSVTFFGDIASLTLSQYKKRIESVSDDEIEADLIQQIHASAEIATSKHKNFTASVETFGLGIIFGLVGWILLSFDIYVR